MSVDDQLFKEDGTLLTKVDNILLRFARKFADILFAEPDDEDYNGALNKIYKLGGIMMIVSGLVRVPLAILYGEPIIIALESVFCIVMVFYGGIHVLAGHFRLASCNGLGSTISSGAKASSLFLLIIIGSLLTFEIVWAIMSSDYIVACGIPWVAGWLHLVLARDYVSRLQNRPPKRKKAPAFKLAFNSDR